MNLTEKEKLAYRNAKKYASLRHYIENGINSVKSVKKLINYQILPVKVSTKRICDNEDHCSQFHYLSEMLLNVYPEVIAWANRGGSKTYFLALINWLKSLIFAKREAIILGASEAQSLRAYEAMSNFWGIGTYEGFDKPLIGKYVEGDTLKQITRFKNESKVYILSASNKSVSGPHPQSLNLDEVDEMDSDVLEMSLSQPQYKHGVPAQVTISSTNHVSNGNMDSLIRKATESNRAKIFKWCVWETLESCAGLYECSTCPLTTFCPGTQMKAATGYYKIEDFLTKLSMLSLYTIQVQWFCNKVGSPDLIYKDEFDPNVHLLSIDFNPRKTVFLSADWGGTHPFCIGVYQDYRSDKKLNAWVKIDEIYMSETDNQHVMAEAKKRPWWDYIDQSGMVCDPSRKDLRIEWNSVGVNTVGANNDVEIGISKVKGSLKPVLGSAKIYFSNKCRNTIREFSSYKKNKKGNIVKENDHAMDELRYFVLAHVNPIVKSGKNKPKLYKSELSKGLDF